MNAKFKPRRIVVGREECVYFRFLHVQRRDHVNAYVYKAPRIIISFAIIHVNRSRFDSVMHNFRHSAIFKIHF